MLALFVAMALCAPVAVARADDSLEELMENAGAGEFHGVGVVMCTWGRDSAAATYQVERSRGMSMVHGPDRDLMLSGSLVAMGSGAEWYALEVSDWSSWSLSDRYSLSEPEPTSRLGRPATEVRVLEDGRVRARVVVDDESTIPLVTEILDGDGRVFRLASLVEFEVGPSADDHAMPEEYQRRTVMEPMAATTALPRDAAGYRLVDTYEAPGGSQSYYSDGLFSFSVFEAKRGRTPAEFDGATRFGIDGQVYRRIVTPTTVWVHWNGPNSSYVLVGDLPPDHLAAVLSVLPKPGDRSIFVKLWRRLFG